MINQIMNSLYHSSLNMMNIIISILRIIYLSLASFVLFLIIILISEYQKNPNLNLNGLINYSCIHQLNDTLTDGSIEDISNFKCKKITDNTFEVTDLNKSKEEN